MKKFLLLFALLLTMSAQAKNKVFERPAFRSTSGEMDPVKVEVGKKETIVHFHARCAHWRQWSMMGARLECDGQVYAYKGGRILTHEGTKVLADEAFEIGRTYEKNEQQDSLILTFEPLPKEAKIFDYIEGDTDRSWRTYGIRLDNRLYPSALPPYQPFVDNGEPLKPLTPTYGEARATLIAHGGGVISYVGDMSRDPITGNFDSRTQFLDSITEYCHPAYMTTSPLFVADGWIDTSGFRNQFPLILIPGETLTLEVDINACYARDHDFAAGKPSEHDYYRISGTLGDLNQALLENQMLVYGYLPELPPCTDGQTFAEWSEQLWQSLDTLRQGLMRRADYTRRQKDFLSLLVDNCYLKLRHNYVKFLSWKMKPANADSTFATLKETYTLIDPHAKDLQLYRDGRTYYLPTEPDRLPFPYLEANGLNHGEVYERLKGFAEAYEIGKKMKLGKVQPDSVILASHPYFHPVLRAFNDSTRVLVGRLEREAKDRMMPTPDVPADQFLPTIVAQHPGKAVFIDLWATWCGPCLNGIKKMEPLKEQLKGQDIVFVYLTNESSPLNKWNEHVLSIPGLHYRLPSSLMQQIPCIAAESGIPQYLIFDRQGHQVWHQVGFSNSVLEDIKQEIGKALDSSSLPK